MDCKRAGVNDDLIADRRRQVAGLRLQQLSQREIATELGVSVATVNRDLKRIRDEWAARRDESYSGWVAEELALLDAMQRALLPEVLVKRKAHVADRILGIMNRRARMLGLDKPELHKHTAVITQDLIDAEIARLEAQLTGAGD